MAKSSNTQEIKWTCLALWEVTLRNRDSSPVDPADQECVEPEEENEGEVISVIAPANGVGSVFGILVIPVYTLVHYWAVHC